VPILLEELVAMSSEIHYQRLCITRSLRQIGRPGVPYLIASLNGQAPEDVVELGRYKHVIISTLGDMRDSRAVGPLLDLFEKNKTSKIRWTSSIASALGLIGDKQAVNPLIAELDASLKRAQETGDWNAGGYDMQACAEALGRLGDKRAIPSLKRALNAGPQGIKGGTQYLVAEEAAQALRALEVEVTGDREKGGYNVIEVAPTPE
jgi:HEAT repeat protein